MSLDLTRHLAIPPPALIGRAVIEALAYSDLFDFPLSIEELHRYLPLPVNLSDLADALNSHDERFETCDGFYFLAGRESLVTIRQQREAASHSVFQRAVRFGHILGAVPFVRMVGLTGSLALLNCDENADIDYVLVATRGRIWLARAFALLLGRLTALMGNTICPNLIIADHILEWQQRDIYSARELCQTIPLVGMEVYARMRDANAWTNSFLPNASDAPPLSPNATPGRSILQAMGEMTLRGAFGDRLEAWEMNRKIKRFTHQAGYGVETRFTPDICQGNFNHHGLQTKEAYRQRLAKLGLR